MGDTRPKFTTFDIDSTRKHYLPQFYLRGFSLRDRPNQIYVLDKKHPEQGVRATSINNIAVSKDAYSVVNDDILKRHENHWAETLNFLKSQSIADLNELIANRKASYEMRFWLARFMIDSTLRSQGFREQTKSSTRIS